jgi:phosphatidylserine/phosphatidylglycerophosphate/cardiolipin synthase-like enzyme
MKRIAGITRLVFCILLPTTALAKRAPSLADQAVTAAKESLIAAPKDGEVCFSPVEPCDVKLTRFIESAQKSIDIAIYDINLDNLVHHILVASKSLPVRIVVDQRQAQGKHSLVRLLVKAGANLRFGHQRGIMHDKFTIIDEKMVETGSFNYTNHASQANNENQVYLANPEIVKRYHTRFEEIWNEASQEPLRGVSGSGR